MTPPTEKRCTACGEVKTAEEFGYQRDKWGVGLYSRCRPCRNRINSQRAAERRRTDPDFLARGRASTHRSEQTPAAKARRAAKNQRAKIKGTPEWAGRQLHDAVKHGRLAKPDVCGRCGAMPPRHQIHGHHWHGDYAGRPLEVEWLCSLCHGAEHSQRGSTHGQPSQAEAYPDSCSRDQMDRP